MGKGNSGYSYLSTTGAGIAVGSGPIEFGGFIRGSDLAGTLIIKDSATVVFTNSATAMMTLGCTPIALRGPVTMTSSAGDHYVVFYRQKVN
jgi:hypothetical protein